jgi:protease-4
MIVRVLTILCLMGSIAAAASPTTQATTTAPTPAPALHRMAYMQLDRDITEKPSDFSFLASEQATTLHSVLDRLEKARNDKELQGVLITLGGSGINLSQALEVRDALVDLRKAGKRTFVYADAYDTPTYILATGATDVCILGGGEIEMPGVGLETMFFKGLFDKIGVEADFEQIGEYKGADEEFIHTEPSAELRGELNRLVDGLYDQLILSISTHRNLPAQQVRDLVDQAMIQADLAKKSGLVDHLVDEDGLRDLMADELGGKVDLIHDYGDDDKENVDLSSPFAFFSLLTRRPAESDRQSVALIYADGVIEDGSTDRGLLGSSTGIGSDDMRQALRIADRDDKIGAVVIRIDSPGGSALASEAMWQAVHRVGHDKPVIISVGSMAASGGYYLACSGSYIFADPTAIVGSIGVVGGKFVLKDLYAKLGLSSATFTRGANAGLFGSDQPWTPDQRKLVHDWMQQTYEKFTTRVMSGRKGKIKDIDKIARGRIFLAPQAKDLGMVDDIGGVNDAVAYAAKRAGFAPGSYDVRVVPAPKTLADLFNGGSDTQTSIHPRVEGVEGTQSLGLAAPAVLGMLSPTDRALLTQELAVMRLFQAHPVALVCPYLVTGR